MNGDNYKFLRYRWLVVVLFLSGCYVGPEQGNIAGGAVSSSFSKIDPQKIAIVVEPSRGRNFSERSVEDQLAMGLIRKGYSVVARSDVETILKELKFQQSGLTNADAAKIGKLLNVPVVLIVNVTNLDVKYERGLAKVDGAMGGRLISVEGGEILWINTVKYQPIFYSSSGNDVSATVMAMSSSLVQSFPPRSVAQQK